MRVSASLLVTAALGASLVACVLFVPAPSDDSGATCGLTSDELGTSCGTCVASECRAELDRCCAEGRACEAVIPAVVLCADEPETCAAAGDGGVELSLRSCASSRCVAACGDGAPSADGGVDVAIACRTESRACICQVLVDGGAGSGSCKPSSSVPGECCATTGYPAAGGACFCSPKHCVVDDGHCSCGHYVGTSSTTRSSCPSTSGVCCYDPAGGECECDDGWTSCPRGTEVSSCEASEVVCPEIGGIPSKTTSACTR